MRESNLCLTIFRREFKAYFESPVAYVFLVVFLLLIGFPISLFFAWAFEITPDGIKRESEVPQDASRTHETAAKAREAVGSVLSRRVVAGAGPSPDDRVPQPVQDH